MGSICFFGVDNCRMLSPQGGEKAPNGEAVQQVLLARAFRDRGFDVSTVVCNSTVGDGEVIDGIRVYQAFAWHEGLPVIRFVHPRATGAYTALRKANADIYYQSPAGVFTGVTAAFCRANGRKFIFRVASDANCVPGKQLIRLWRDRKIFEYGMRNAHLIAVQSSHQRDLLKDHYDLSSEVVNMVLESPPAFEIGSKTTDIVWVSNLRPVKRAEVALEAAAKLSRYRFTMIGGAAPGYEDYFRRIAAAAKRLDNVDFLGALSYEETNSYIEKARVLLNTSTVEGFPNTFLQAWARGTPVVSFFDPDEIMQKETLGIVPESDEHLASALEELLQDSDSIRDMGCRAHRYAQAHFSAQSAVERYIRLVAGSDR